MTKISLIAAVDQQWGLGKNNQLLCHLPDDLKHFKTLTLGKPVIMGRKTWDSIGKPLPGRMNIVVSRQNLTLSGASVVPTIEDAVAAAGPVDEVMIIGGGEIYRQALSLADQIYLTHIDHQFEADVFFPKLPLDEWQAMEIEQHPADTRHAYGFSFKTWCRKR